MSNGDAKTLHGSVLKRWSETTVIFDRKEAERFVDTAPQSESAKDLLEWANRHPYLRVSRNRIPDGILPASAGEVYLNDIAVKPPRRKRGQRIIDDDVYDAFPHIRTFIPRGTCVLEQITGGNGPVGSCPPRTTSYEIVIFAMKKFTGGPGDDDDQEFGEEDEGGDAQNSGSTSATQAMSRWEHYFIEPVSNATHIIRSSKENGEASHLGLWMLPGTDSEFCYILGSKNVHLLANKLEDIEMYKESRYLVARSVAKAMLEQFLLPNKGTERMNNFLNHMWTNRLTTTLEFLQLDNQHVELFDFERSKFRFITFTSNRELRSLCVDDIEASIEVARAAGFETMTIEKHDISEIDAVFRQIRDVYGKEGSVIYYVSQKPDGRKKVIGMVKKKSAWYIVVRALREKMKGLANRVSNETQQQDDGASRGAPNRKRGRFDNSSKDATPEYMKRLKKRVRDALAQKQDWIGFSNDSFTKWNNIGSKLADWLAQQVPAGDVKANDVSRLFPVVFDRFLKAQQPPLDDHIGM